MYNILRGIIRSGNFKLDEMRHRIKQMQIMGDITEEQMYDLLEQANVKANVEGERPELIQLIRNLSDKVDQLAEEVARLRGEGVPDTDPEDVEVWTPWDGISNKYQPGSIVMHNGVKWISTFQGQNVWEPGTVGAQFWVKYQEGMFDDHDESGLIEES